MAEATDAAPAAACRACAGALGEPFHTVASVPVANSSMFDSAAAARTPRPVVSS
ncbi:MAG: hypothetical protein R2695_05140 [Acidimicrobiales bacterium]